MDKSGQSYTMVSLIVRQLSNKLSNKLSHSPCASRATPYISHLLVRIYARKNVIVNGASPVASFLVIVIARVVLPPINMFDGFENEYVSPPVIVILHAGAIAIYGQPGSVPLFVTVVTSEAIENG